MKIDRRIKYRLVLDTETCPLDKDCTEVSPYNMLVYDIGWAVVDKRGKVYETASYVVADVFLDERMLMQSAYYATKIPNYWADIKSGQRKLMQMKNIRKRMMETLAKYRIDEIYAHNARFDTGALNVTQRWLTKSRYRYFFPSHVSICDTLQMSRDVLKTMPTYRRFCEDNGFVTAKNVSRYTAEVIYRYITKDITFEESHTGLEDVMIEKEILAYCYKQHRKMRRVLYPARPSLGSAVI